MEDRTKVDNLPLVTIMVITYNSSRFVRETLDSVAAQTYPNIELVITDDNSSDNTLELCRQWKDINHDKCKDIKIVTTTQNTGVSGNCRRGVDASKGVWIKPIAGDDILLPDAIENYVRYVTANPKCHIVFGKTIYFEGSVIEHINDIPHQLPYESLFFHKRMTSKGQFRILTKNFAGNGPTSFFSKEAYDKIGGFDLRFPFVEDHPLYIKMTKHGFRMYKMDKVTVYYRVSSGSITKIKENTEDIFPKFRVRYIREYRYGFQMENLNSIWKLLMLISIWLQNRVLKTGNNYSLKRSRIAYYVYRVFDPINWYSRGCIYLSKMISLFE